MIKYTAFIVLIMLRIVYQPTQVQATNPPFTSPVSTTATPPAKLLSIEGRIVNNKVIIDWCVGENETADKFEVEKSLDGKNFSMAALVFGTDAPAKGIYQFYEKAGNQKVSYRIKLVNKDRQTEYSQVVEIVPTV